MSKLVHIYERAISEFLRSVSSWGGFPSMMPRRKWHAARYDWLVITLENGHRPLDSLVLRVARHTDEFRRARTLADYCGSVAAPSRRQERHATLQLTPLSYASFITHIFFFHPLYLKINKYFFASRCFNSHSLIAVKSKPHIRANFWNSDFPAMKVSR